MNRVDMLRAYVRANTTPSDADLVRALTRHTPNRSALARALHVNRSTINRWVKQGDALTLHPRMRALLVSRIAMKVTP